MNYGSAGKSSIVSILAFVDQDDFFRYAIKCLIICFSKPHRGDIFLAHS